VFSFLLPVPYFLSSFPGLVMVITFVIRYVFVTFLKSALVLG